MTEWISVKDRLPTKVDFQPGTHSVLVFMPHYFNTEGLDCGPIVNMCVWTGKKFYMFENWVTHWMPLPEPPK